MNKLNIDDLKGFWSTLTQTQRIMLATIVDSKISIPKAFSFEGIVSTIEAASTSVPGKLFFGTEIALLQIIRESPTLDFETIFRMALDFKPA